MNTTYFLNCIAGNVFGSKTDTPLPKKYYVGLSKTHPNQAGTGDQEPSGGGYARKEITAFTQPADGSVSNSADIVFNESTASWGVMTDYVVYDALSGGHLLAFDYLRDPQTKKPVTRTVEGDTTMRIKAGTLHLWFKDDTSLPNS